MCAGGNRWEFGRHNLSFGREQVMGAGGDGVIGSDTARRRSLSLRPALSQGQLLVENIDWLPAPLPSHLEHPASIGLPAARSERTNQPATPTEWISLRYKTCCRTALLRLTSCSSADHCVACVRSS